MPARTLIPTLAGTLAGVSGTVTETATAAGEIRTAAISFVAALLTAIACRLVDRYTPPGKRRPPSLTRRRRPKVKTQTDENRPDDTKG